MRNRLIYLLLCLLATATITAQQAARPLSLGQPDTADVNNAQPVTSFTFEGRAGQIIYITMLDETETLDMELRLLAPSGALLGMASESVAVLLGPITLVEDGRYTISAGRPSFSDSEGVFSILVEETTIRDLDISLGEPQNESLSGRGSAHFYRFSGTAGDLFAYQLVGEEIGIAIFDPNGQRFIADGYYERPLRPIETLPLTGDYLAVIQTINRDGSPYTLRIQQVEPIPLISGEAMADTMLESEPALFAFESAAGKTWQISAQLPEGGDRRLEILLLTDRESWERTVAADYGSGPGGNPRIEPFIAPNSATYYVILAYDNYNGNDDIIPYQVTLTSSTIVSIAPGQTIEGETGLASGEVTYFYDGKEDEDIRLMIARTSESGEIGIQVLSPVDEVANFYGRDVKEVIIEARLPISGQYRIIVRNNAYDDSVLNYALTLQKPE